MQMQVEAERKKRAAILDSEGIREADINVAEGKRQSTILASGKLLKSVFPCMMFIHCFYFYYLEADQQEQINKAQGEANALLAVAEAKAKGIRLIADALKQTV